MQAPINWRQSIHPVRAPIPVNQLDAFTKMEVGTPPSASSKVRLGSARPPHDHERRPVRPCHRLKAPNFVVDAGGVGVGVGDGVDRREIENVARREVGDAIGVGAGGAFGPGEIGTAVIACRPTGWAPDRYHRDRGCQTQTSRHIPATSLDACEEI